ncbi:intradiol ring-cleavage dioxygenase [Actinokineospora sp.]|uniref:intradiol ring-cleavage dioxygenase n=1 Tax=Actinokineospora sp. TaxID=1872133 RepID=UPI003D6A95D2
MDDHDRGLAFDLAILGRRRMLTLLGGAGLSVLAGCSTPTATQPTTGTTSPQQCAEKIPEETAGPYPGDGANGPNALTESGIVRTDIRSSFGSSTTTAAGVPLTIELTVTKDCAPLSQAAVYLWQCDIDGRYSMYSPGVTEENYLRGVQETDGSGKVRFTSVFPGAYAGRWPHIHFEVYPSLAEATKAGEPTVTSQLALPEDVCETVYATDGYAQSVRNLQRSSLESDMVFRDGHDTQLAATSGDVGSGFTATLTIAI